MTLIRYYYFITRLTIKAANYNQNVTKLLRSAGMAVKALTEASSNETGQDASNVPPIQQQKKEFTAATTEYFALVSSVDVGLRQQINALEEAEIIAKEAVPKESQSSDPAGASTQASAGSGPPPIANRSTITNGGLGNLDISWLNSRNDKVGKEMEAELWQKASSFLADLEKSRKSNTESSEQGGMADS